ncbi:MAG: hypothetical protein K9N10_01705 [Deltaproteobacteria bacterium]|nr:hypothetical protein [Deltaproteobacteria bacterium]
MKKSVSWFLIVFAFLLPCNAAFSDGGKTDEKTKAHLLEDIFILNKQISKMNYINKRSRNILKNTKNKYSYEIYLSFTNIYKTFLWCSDLSHWLSQTYTDQDSMRPHILGRLTANKKSIIRSLNYINKIYKNINNITLLNIIDTQEKVIDSGLGQLDNILTFAEEVEKKP